MAMKKLPLFIIAFGMLISMTARAHLSVSPFYVSFDAGSKARSDIVRMTNTSNQPKTYRVKLINYQQKADGSYKEISEPIPGNPFAAPYIGYSPHETRLEPRQSQTIRLQRKAMAAAPDGEYVSHLLIQEMPGEKAPQQPVKANELKIDIRPLYGVTIPVIIDKGNLSNSGAVIQARLLKDAKHPQVEVKIKRKGTQAFWGTLIVKEGKQEIGRVNDFKIFMTTPERIIRVPLTKVPSSKTQLILMDARNNAIISSQEI